MSDVLHWEALERVQSRPCEPVGVEVVRIVNVEEGVDQRLLRLTFASDEAVHDLPVPYEQAMRLAGMIIERMAVEGCANAVELARLIAENFAAEERDVG